MMQQIDQLSPLKSISIPMSTHLNENLSDKLSLLTDNQLINTQQNAQTEINYFDGLKPYQYYGYGVGHFMNDLGGAIYFNYLLYFLKRVVLTSSAPTAFLIGQIVDGLVTPIIGYLSDKTSNTKYGKRKPWYISGFIIFLIGYFGLYQNIVYLHPGISEEKQAAYYITFMVLVNIGWAAVQISHMSLVPSLTCSIKRRDKLNNIRNSFTFLSNLVILGSGTLLFAFASNSTIAINILSYIGASLGIPAAIVFVCTINQYQLTKITQEKLRIFAVNYPESQVAEKIKLKIKDQQQNNNGEKKTVINWKYWFKLPKFYVFGFCYMSVRLYCNLYGTLLPFYLVDVLKMGTQEQIQNNQIPFQVALVSLVITVVQYINSHLISVFYYNKIGRKNTLIFGTLFAILSSLVMIFITPNYNWIMFIVAIFVGLSQTLVLSTGINLISDVIGTNSSDGAFVFGIYSLLDKISSGVAIYFIISSSEFDKNVNYKKWMAIIMPSIMCIISSVIVFLTPVNEYKKDSKEYEKIENKDDILAEVAV